MHQNVKKSWPSPHCFFFVFIAQLCCGCASRTHLTDVSEALDSLSRNVTFTTPERICDFWGRRDNTVTPDQGHSRSYVSGGPVSCDVVKVTAAKKKKNPICGEICLKLGAIIQFKTECDSLWIKQLLHCNGRAAFKSLCLFPKWNGSFSPKKVTGSLSLVN